MTGPTATEPRRRRLTLSVRTLMLLVLVIGGPIGWKARSATHQRRSVEAIRRMGGSVGYDWQGVSWEGQESDAAPPQGPAAPRWARRLLGDEYFQEVVEVDLLPGCLGEGPAGDPQEVEALMRKQMAAREADQLACLDGLDRLEWLSLSQFGELKAEGLARLGRLGRLRGLVIEEVDDRVAASLGHLTRLEWLYAHAKERPGASDQDIEAGRASIPVDLAFLDQMSRLRVLTFFDIAVDDEAMGRIGRLERLEDFSATASEKLTDAGMAHLRRLKSLKTIELLPAPKITDVGMAGQKSLENLEVGGRPPGQQRP